MWQLIGIEAHNFWLYRDVKLDLSGLKPGSIVFIHGENKDATDAVSNYTGKTLLSVDFIRWVVDGKYPRLKGVNDVIGKFDRYAMGKLIYRNGKKKLTICRYRKHKTYKNKLRIRWRGKWISGERVAETRDLITRIMGISPARFIRGTLFTNDPSESLLLKTPALRNRELAEIWGIGLFDDAAKLGAKICTKLDKRMVSIRTRVEALARMKSKIKANLVNLREDVKSFKKQREEEVAAIDERIAKLKDLIALEPRIVRTLKADRAEVHKLKDAIVELKRRLVESDEIVNRINSIKTSIASAKERRKAVAEEIAILRSDMKDIRDGIKTGSICDECGSKVTNSGKTRLTDRKLSLIRKMRKRDVSLEESIEQNRSKIIDLRDVLKGYNVQTVTDQIASLSGQIVDKEASIANTKKYKVRIAAAKNKIKELKEDKIELKDKKNPVKDRIKSELDEMSETTREIASLIDEAERVEREFKSYKFLSGAKGLKLLRNLVLRRKVDAMSDEFDTHLDRITDGAIRGQWSVLDNGDIKESFIDAFEGTEKLFSGFSSAQRTKILLSQDLASATLYAPNIGHMTIDERLDAGVDSLGIDRILEYLRSSVVVNKLVFLTSHRLGVQTKCDAIIRIVRQGGVATATLET